MTVANVSIIIPTYNGSRFIKETLRSIMAQTVLPEQIIVVDDASTDGTPATAEQCADDLGLNIDVIRLSRNSGSPSRPTNIGIDAAKGEFIAVLDQDDVFCPSKLESECAALTSNPDVGYAFSLSAPLDQPSVPWQSTEVLADLQKVAVATERFAFLSGSHMLHLLLKHGCFVIGFPGFTFRKTIWERSGGIDESLRIADHDFLCRISKYGSVAWVPTINYLRRIHDSNLSGDRLTVGWEFVKVATRSISCAAEAESLQSVRNMFIGIGFALRDAGWYSESLQCFRAAGRIWGWRPDTVAACAKLGVHYLAKRTRRLP